MAHLLQQEYVSWSPEHAESDDGPTTESMPERPERNVITSWENAEGHHHVTSFGNGICSIFFNQTNLNNHL